MAGLNKRPKTTTLLLVYVSIIATFFASTYTIAYFITVAAMLIITSMWLIDLLYGFSDASIKMYKNYKISLIDISFFIGLLYSKLYTFAALFTLIIFSGVYKANLINKED